MAQRVARYARIKIIFVFGVVGQYLRYALYAVKQYAGLKAQLKVAADEMRGFAKEQENIIKIQQASDGSLTQLRRQLSLLTA